MIKESTYFCEAYILGKTELFSTKPNLITECNRDHFKGEE